MIVDEEVESTSSKVAAGIVNPITGKYFAKSWRIDESWPVARAFYREIEARTGGRFFYEMPLVRLLTSEAEVARWGKKAGSASHADYLAQPQADPLLDGELFETELGGFETTNSGYLDVRQFLAVSREVFRAMGCYRAEVFDGAERDGTVVLCQGFKGAMAPGFDWVPFKSAKGEILTLRPKSDLPTDRIVNGGGVWLLPDQAQPGVFRAGSTYSWEPLDSATTPGGREEILAKLRRVCKAAFEVVGQEAAVRPIIRASKALIGLHPAREGLAIFNGLGSKGVLNAPFFAGQLAALLVDGTPVDEEVDIRKNAL